MKENKTEKLYSPNVAIFEVCSKSLGFHNIPFFANSPLEAISAVRSSVVGGKDGYLRDNLDDLSLYCVGFYDTHSGIISVEHCPFLITELSDIPNIKAKAKEGDKT